MSFKGCLGCFLIKKQPPIIVSCGILVPKERLWQKFEVSFPALFQPVGES